MWKFNYYKTDDNVSIRYAIGIKDFDPNLDFDLESIDRYIVFLNGRTQWIELNEKILDDLKISKNTAILTLDHRGQGASQGKRGSIDSYDRFVKDTRSIIENIVGSKPYILMSHSMGGLISLYGVLRLEFLPKSLILISPLLLLPGGKLLRACIGLMYAFRKLGIDYLLKKISDLSSFEYETNRLTHSYKYFYRVKCSPYPVPFPDIAWIRATSKASKFIFKSKNMLKVVSIPVLMIVAQKERVVDSKGFSLWFNKLENLKRCIKNQNQNKNQNQDQNQGQNQNQNEDLKESSAKGLKISNQFFCISGAYHELLTEEKPFRDKTISIINNWISIIEFDQIS